MGRRIRVFMPKTSFGFETVENPASDSLFGRLKMNYVFLSTAIRISPLFGGHAGDAPDRIFINFLDLQVVTHIILIHDMRLSSVSVSVKGAFGETHNRRGRSDGRRP